MRINLFVALLCVSGCATTANYEKLLQTWVGDSEDNLVSKWGPPDSSYALSNGGKVLQYSRSQNIQFGGNTYMAPVTTFHHGTVTANDGISNVNGSYSGTSTSYVPKTAPVENVQLNCATRFTVNKNGRITNWAWQGNSCKARDPK